MDCCQSFDHDKASLDLETRVDNIEAEQPATLILLAT